MMPTDQRTRHNDNQVVQEAVEPLRGATARGARRWRRPVAFLVAFAILWFGFLELRGLYFPDEGRYAEIPREMLVSGDWVTPRLNAFPYFEKPPLQYWITAAIFAVAGEDEWTARLWPAAAGLLAVLAVLFTARRVFSARAAWMAASVMASSCGYFLAGQFITLDIGLTSLLTCALCAFLLAQRDGVPVREERRWMLVAWAACALAVLIKGAIGAVIPAMALVTYVLIARDFAVLRRLHIGLGLLLFTLLTVPWFVAVELDNPGFNHFFFVTEHFQRFTQPEHNRRGPWWYFIPVAVLLLTPWGPAIVAAAVRRLPSTAVRPANGFRVQWFLSCWAGAIFLFFSLSSSKLPAYILPAIGAVVLAMAVPLARRWDATVRITAWTLIASGVVVAIGALPAGNLIKVALVRESYADSIGWMIAAGIFFAVGGALALLLLRRRRRIAALGATVVCILVACQLGVVVAHKVDGYFSAERLIERVIGNERPFHPDVPFYSVGWFDHTVPFYLGRTVALVGDKGELASDLAAVPSNYVKTEAMFVAEWNALREAYAIMPPGLYDRLRGEGVPMRFIDTDGRRVIVSRH